MLHRSDFSSLRENCIAIDEAISGVCYYLHEIATQPTAARNDDFGIHATTPGNGIITIHLNSPQKY
ncbi:hypothetical protein [Rickettsia tamurae]|uniref:hypothetical protein n=1 Tax=Rickettsia tamurae TaxID=334545 RepID=UPI001BFD26F8|nr:hypothetical protein [Rickettsia tamurae]